MGSERSLERGGSTARISSSCCHPQKSETNTCAVLPKRVSAQMRSGWSRSEVPLRAFRVAVPSACSTPVLEWFGFFQLLEILLWVKDRYATWNPGKWTPELKPASPGSLMYHICVVFVPLLGPLRDFTCSFFFPQGLKQMEGFRKFRGRVPAVGKVVWSTGLPQGSCGCC